MRDCHLLDLQSITSEEVTRVVLTFPDCFFELEMDQADELITCVRRCYAAYTEGGDYPEELKFKLRVHPPHRIRALEPPDPGPDRLFIPLYCAFANKFHTKETPEILEMLQHIFATGVTTLDLNRIADLNIADLQAFASALHHNTHFTSLVLRGAALGDVALQAISQIFVTNSTLTALLVPELGVSREGVIRFARTLESSHVTCKLRTLDLSNAEVQDRGALALVNAIQALSHGLEELYLGHCSISSRGTVALLQALRNHTHTGATLHVLDLSFNTLGQPGSSALVELLPNLRVIHALGLAGTQLDIVPVVSVLRQHNASLRSLNLAANKIDKVTAMCLVETMATTPTLHTFNVAATRSSSESLVAMTGALCRNRDLARAHLSVSENTLNAVWARRLAETAATSTNLHTFILEDTPLGDKTLIALLEGFEANQSLQWLSLARSWKGATVKSVRALAAFVNSHPGLRKLDISGSDRARLGLLLRPFFDSLTNNTSLTTLHVDANQMRDEGVEDMAEFLRKNRALRELTWDNNQATLAGFKAIRDALDVNRTLYICPIPRNDLSRAMRSLGNNERSLNLLRDTVEEIRAKLRGREASASAEATLDTSMAAGASESRLQRPPTPPALEIPTRPNPLHLTPGQMMMQASITPVVQQTLPSPSSVSTASQDSLPPTPSSAHPPAAAPHPHPPPHAHKPLPTPPQRAHTDLNTSASSSALNTSSLSVASTHTHTHTHAHAKPLPPPAKKRSGLTSTGPYTNMNDSLVQDDLDATEELDLADLSLDHSFGEIDPHSPSLSTSFSSISLSSQAPPASPPCLSVALPDTQLLPALRAKLDGATGLMHPKSIAALRSDLELSTRYTSGGVSLTGTTARHLYIALASMASTLADADRTATRLLGLPLLRKLKRALLALGSAPVLSTQAALQAKAHAAMYERWLTQAHLDQA